MYNTLQRYVEPARAGFGEGERKGNPESRPGGTSAFSHVLLEPGHGAPRPPRPVLRIQGPANGVSWRREGRVRRCRKRSRLRHRRPGRTRLHGDDAADGSHRRAECKSRLARAAGLEERSRVAVVDGFVVVGGCVSSGFARVRVAITSGLEDRRQLPACDPHKASLAGFGRFASSS